MPLKNIVQPETIDINDKLRLRKYDGNYPAFLPAYQQPYLYRNSEGILEDAKKPDLAYVRRMCEYLDREGELYYIEAKENGVFRAIGDVTVKQENPPIAIWEEKYRGRGVGSAVMRAVIARLEELGFRKITGSEVFVWNVPSQKMHEKLGFRRVREDERTFYYELDLSDETAKPAVKIDAATPDDAEACARIQTESWKAAFRGILDDEVLAQAADLSRAKGMYGRVLAREGMHGLILRLDGAPHAIAFWSRSRDADTADFAELICIHSLPGNWRKGYGIQLMTDALDEMRRAGYRRAMLWVFAKNARARAFYEKCGWTLTERRKTDLGAETVQYERDL